MKFTKKKNQTNKTKKTQKNKQKNTNTIYFFLQKLITINIQLKGEL